MVPFINEFCCVHRDDDSEEESKKPSQPKNTRYEFRDEEEKEERITEIRTHRRTKTTKSGGKNKVNLGAAASFAAEAKEDTIQAQNSQVCEHSVFLTNNFYFMCE